MNFNNLFWNIHGKKGKVETLYPEVLYYKEFALYEHRHKENVLRYMNYLYSAESPLIKKYRDNVDLRRKEAAKLAELSPTQIERDIFELKDTAFLLMVVRFLSIQKNVLWSNIVSNEQTFAENLRIILEPLTGDDEKKRLESTKLKAHLIDVNKSIQNNLTVYYKEFFKEDELLQEKSKMIDMLMTTPEEIALIKRDW
jgi:hypothetical protein